MTSWEGQTLTGLAPRLKAVLRAKTLLALWALCALYWLAYVTISRSATYVQHASFWGQERAVSVKVGSLHVSADGYERFMGTVFHPVLLALTAAPLVLAILLLLALAVLMVWAQSAAQKERQEQREDLAAAREHRRKMEEIDAEKKKIHFVGSRFVGVCPSCGAAVNSETGKCPSCGASLAQ